MKNPESVVAQVCNLTFPRRLRKKETAHRRFGW
jgi:hypothetical protein